jgi:hypothetical protein
MKSYIIELWNETRVNDKGIGTVAFCEQRAAE